MAEPLWLPSQTRLQRANLTCFMDAAAEAAGRPFDGYDALWEWSVSEPAAFWETLWSWSGLIAHAPYRSVLTPTPEMIGTRWFEGSTLNFAENLLRHEGDRPALIAIDERDGAPREISWDELRTKVAQFQSFLKAHGVGVGDRVAAWMPNREETVIAMLAAAGLGAIFSSSSPDFGIRGVLDRFGQIEPTILLSTDCAYYGGKQHSMTAKLAEVIESLPSLKAVVLVQTQGPELHGLPKAIGWTEALKQPDSPLHFEPLPFDHPLYIMYSSGTTGVPKCIVHGAGGTLLQHIKEHMLHTDVRPGDKVFYFTTCGWMMWNWLVSALFTGATVVLWDGSPVVPTPDVLWRHAANLGITVFGTSPKFLSLCEKEGLTPGRTYDLSGLRAVLSTGSPLSIENFRYVYSAIGEDIQLASICGGTDIISCFMLGSPISPVFPGEIQKRGLGMAVEAWAGNQEPVIGQKAELVCTQPFPSMPVGFYNDPGDARYKKAYFTTFPGVWHHGDFIEVTENQGIIVYGRSDATLNPGGVRIGTAEIYRPVEAMSEIKEALVVGLPTEDDVEVILYVVLQPSVTLDETLIRALRSQIRKLASPRHVPARIHAVPAVPRTISGKKVEIAVSRVLQGMDAPNRDALGNPEALDWFQSNRASLQ